MSCNRRGPAITEPIWKVKTPRDKKYLKWIRSCPCFECGTRFEVQAHHIETGGVSLKCSDYLTVPLCAARCHPAADKSKGSKERYLPVALAYQRLYPGVIKGE